MINKRAILSPNSEFERREELLRLSNCELSEKEKEILRACDTEDHESIGMIGCLLAEENRKNSIRLLIATRNRSNLALAEKAKNLLGDIDEQEMIESLSEVFLLESDSLSPYEDKLLFILFGYLKSSTYSTS
ncbi:hypothetical protein ML462_08480 [Gramella lutea]|uniref:Uncharacterized protein n=1 Tax=Christiangramia lutea TaxID=1607951 RepID=A0A9X2A936_9FLAO|nr:hypothetical protein [Christiangramia lutea]MCH4823209.1 hypothetical protein [Christiangramia lutea]